MFAGGGKKGKSADKEGASRFKKDLITYKNQALLPVSRGTAEYIPTSYIMFTRYQY